MIPPDNDISISAFIIVNCRWERNYNVKWKTFSDSVDRNRKCDKMKTISKLKGGGQYGKSTI